jgi:hypothetical protein
LDENFFSYKILGKFTIFTVRLFLATIFCLAVAGVVAVHLGGMVLLHRHPIACGRWQLESWDRNFCPTIDAMVGGRRIVMENFSCPRPFFAIWEWLRHRPCHGGIRIGCLRIGEPDLENGPQNLVTATRCLLSLLHSPLLRYPLVTVERVQWSGGNLFLSQLWWECGHLGANLCRESGNVILHWTLDLRTLRPLLRQLSTRQTATLRDESFPIHALANLRGTAWFQNFPMALLSPLFPVHCQGNLNGHLTFANDGPLGMLDLVDGRLHTPTGWVGLRDGSLHLRLVPGRVDVVSANGRMEGGGGELRLAGSVAHRRWNRPNFSLHSWGKDCLILRQGGVALRGDWDVQLRTDPDDVATLAGSITMRRSFWFADGLHAIMAPPLPRSSGATDFPPWRLCLGIDGENFLRIRTPYLQGFLSAALTVGGTLNRPEVEGQLSLERATIFFPFARFTVSHGRIAYDPSRNDGPLWDIQAKSRLYGHDLLLTLAGRGPLPPLRFSSLPSLAPGEIAAMVMSGHPPSGGDEGSLPTLGVLGAYLGTGFLGGNPFDRIRIQMGQDADDAGHGAVGVEYVLDERNSIIVDYDSFDHCSVDYRRRIR